MEPPLPNRAFRDTSEKDLKIEKVQENMGQTQLVIWRRLISGLQGKEYHRMFVLLSLIKHIKEKSLVSLPQWVS